VSRKQSTRLATVGMAILGLAVAGCSRDVETPMQPPSVALDVTALPERCDIGDATAAFEAFYPGLFAVNTYGGLDENGELIWIVERPEGLGHGVARCQYRTFAAAVPYLPNSWEFCANDVFLGGNVHSIPYSDPVIQSLLDFYYPDVEGSYRLKAIAELSRVRDEVRLTRETYFDEDRNERNIGDGGPGDPAATDPTAGAPKLQEMVVTGFRDFFSGDGKVVQRQWGFFGQLEAGTYWAPMFRYYDEVLVEVLDPVELVILPCDP
jgi:hypothetical protein